MTEPLLRVSALRKVFRIRDRTRGGRSREVIAADGIDLALQPGQAIALVGESGSGKTTLGRIITRQDKPSAGHIAFAGASVGDFHGASLRAYRRQVQMVFQNPFEALSPRLTIGETLREPLDIHSILPRGERDGRVRETLEAVGLRPADQFMDSYPANLSGGQLQRVAIARALIVSPKIIVADEPVSMLDMSVRADVMNMMMELQRQTDVAYIYITHDLAVARFVAERIAVLYLGLIVEEGPAEALIATPAHPYTQLLVSSSPDHRFTEADFIEEAPPASGGRPAQGCVFEPRCRFARPVCRAERPLKMELPGNRWAYCHFANEMIAAEGATE